MFHRRSLPLALAALGLTCPALAQGQAPSGACELAPADHPSAGALVDLPFRTVNGRIYLEAEVNGQGPFVFALDTGASGMGRADAQLVSALALPAAGTGETSDGINTAQVDTVRIARLALGGLERQELTVIARDYRSRLDPEAAFDGILGREFFADGLLVIDFPARRVAFYRDRAMEQGTGDSLTYERAFRVPVKLGDIETTGNVDTGANVTLVLPGPLHRQLADAPELQQAGRVGLTNTSIESATARLAGPVHIGALTLENVDVRVAEEFPELLVGAYALQNSVVLIDQRHQTLAICPVRPNAPDSERAEQEQQPQE